MSGSFYSLDTKYNSLLALLADLGITAASVNNLDEVLTEGNDAGNHTITNLQVRDNALVNGTTSVYYNASTGELGHAQSVFPTIDIDYVLQEGNDANSQSITNLSGLQLSSGGVTFPDATIQTTAFTGQVDNLSAVLTEGNDAGNQTITNLQVRDNVLVGGTKSVFYNETTGELGQAAVVFPTIDLDYVLQEGNDANNQDITNLNTLSYGTLFDNKTEIKNHYYRSFKYDAATILDLEILIDNQSQAQQKISIIGYQKSTPVIIAGTTISANSITGHTNIGGALPFLITGEGGVKLISKDLFLAITYEWFFKNNGQLVFPDATIQTTAFTGQGNLTAVLTAGNDAGSQSITNLSGLQLSSGGVTFPDATIQTTAFTGSAFTNPYPNDITMNGVRVGRGSTPTLSGTDIVVGNNVLPYTQGSYCVAIGDDTGVNNYKGDNNIYIGYQAGRQNYNGDENIAIGREALYYNAYSSSTAVGFEAIRNINIGDNNTAIGHQALKCVYNALSNLRVRNIAVGSGALRDAAGYPIATNDCVAVGFEANKNGGTQNICIGSYSFTGSSNQGNNVAIGHKTGQLNTNGFNNVFVGNFVGQNSTSAYNNVCIGHTSAINMSTARFNSLLGYQSGYQLTSGEFNTLMGDKAGYFVTAGKYNTFLGASAGYACYSDSNVAIGYQSQWTANSAANFNTSVGANSLYTNGDYGVANTAIGYKALELNDTGADNVAIGYLAGSDNVTGFGNTFLGARTSGGGYSYNGSTAIGYNALILGDQSVFIGEPYSYNPQPPLLGGNKRVVIFGDLILEYGYNYQRSVYGGSGYKCRQGVSGLTYGNTFNTWWTGSQLQFWIDYTNVYSVSDYRVKENITEPQPVLDRLCAVKMIEYEYKEEGIFKKGGRMLGVLAHELQEAFPELESVVTGEKDAVDEKGNILLQNLHEKHTMLYMKAIQELNAKVEAQQKQIEQLIALLAK